MVKQILPEFGQECINQNLSNLEFGRASKDSKQFSCQLLINSVNEIIHKLWENFKEELLTLAPITEKNQELTSDEKKAKNTEILKNYQQKIQNLKAMFEVELQNKFRKAQISNSNAWKFEKELQKQLAMKLSRKEKLSLAIYQERYIQEYIKEKYQVLKANNETLQQCLIGHNCPWVLNDSSENSIMNFSKEINIACSFLPRLKARTDNFSKS